MTGWNVRVHPSTDVYAVLGDLVHEARQMPMYVMVLCCEGDWSMVFSNANSIPTNDPVDCMRCLAETP